jgi:glycosyltransferase involved in cell wall biosynthesis
MRPFGTGSAMKADTDPATGPARPTFGQHLVGPLRVAFVLTQDRGGPVDVTVQLASELARRDGVEVRLFAPVPARGAGEVAGLLEESRVEGKGAVGAIRAARRRILDWHPDVVHAQDRRSGLVCSGLRRTVVHTYHGVPDDVPLEWLAGAARPRPSRYTRAVLSADAAVARAVTRTIVVSPDMADVLTRRLKVPARKIVHIDNGLQLPLPLALPVRGPVRRLLFVGLLVPRKGVHVLLDALADPRLPTDLTLRIAGDGPERGALEAQARTLGLADRVEFLGFREDVPKLLGEADAFVLPSQLEQQPLVLIEALGAGLPCLATDVGGVADQLGDDGVVVPPNSAPALADGLLSLLASDVTELGARAARRARDRFSIGRCADRHLELYRSL